MSAAQLLADLEAIGVGVALRETGPVLTGPGKASVPPALLDRLKACRSGVIAEVEGREHERAFACVREALEHGTPCPAPPGGDEQGALPPSWSDDWDPMPGALCFCCSAAVWWRYADECRGWCCMNCHPPPPGCAVAFWATTDVPSAVSRARPPVRTALLNPRRLHEITA